MSKTLFPTHRIAELICNFIARDLSPEESEELAQWINESEKNRELFSELTDPKTVLATIFSSKN